MPHVALNEVNKLSIRATSLGKVDDIIFKYKFPFLEYMNILYCRIQRSISGPSKLRLSWKNDIIFGL